MFIRRIKEKGFTLLETVIAIGVVAVGGITIITLLNSTLAVTSLNKDIIVVVNLAREGAEIVRAVRDSSSFGFNSLVDGSYLVDSDTNFGLNKVALGVNPQSPDIVDCTNCTLNLSTDGRYVHSSGSTTRFSRLISVKDVSVASGGVSCVTSNPCHKRVTSTVEWTNGKRSRQYSVVVELTDWR